MAVCRTRGKLFVKGYISMENKFLVETSARHIHLTAEAVEILYGKGAELTVKKMLSQPGQFATANEKIRLVGSQRGTGCQCAGACT